KPMARDATEVLLEAAQSFDLVFEDITPPKDGFLDSNGIRMHYLDWGQAGKPPVLFLHGGGLTAHTRDFTSLQLRHGYHCYALDQRGHGDTEGTMGGGDVYSQREDMEHFRDTLPDARLVTIAGAGHTVQGDRPKEFAAALPTFLQEIGY